MATKPQLNQHSQKESKKQKIYSAAVRKYSEKARGAGLRGEHHLHEKGIPESLYVSRKAALLLIM